MEFAIGAIGAIGTFGAIGSAGCTGPIDCKCDDVIKNLTKQ